jgi:P pilus assembly chaperone PapD
MSLIAFGKFLKSKRYSVRLTESEIKTTEYVARQAASTAALGGVTQKVPWTSCLWTAGWSSISPAPETPRISSRPGVFRVDAKTQSTVLGGKVV